MSHEIYAVIEHHNYHAVSRHFYTTQTPVEAWSTKEAADRSADEWHAAKKDSSYSYSVVKLPFGKMPAVAPKPAKTPSPYEFKVTRPSDPSEFDLGLINMYLQNHAEDGWEYHSTIETKVLHAQGATVQTLWVWRRLRRPAGE